MYIAYTKETVDYNLPSLKSMRPSISIIRHVMILLLLQCYCYEKLNMRSKTNTDFWKPACACVVIQGRHELRVAYADIVVVWLGGVVVRALDLRSKGRGFDFRLKHCRAMTLGKLFSPMCLCSPSSIIWYLARAFILMRLYVAAMHGSNEQGEYCRSGSAVIAQLLRTAI